jgi:hypothetical protein
MVFGDAVLIYNSLEFWKWFALVMVLGVSGLVYVVWRLGKELSDSTRNGIRYDPLVYYNHRFAVLVLVLATVGTVALVEYLRQNSIDPYDGPALWQWWRYVHYALDAVFSILLVAILVERVALGAKRDALHHWKAGAFVVVFISVIVTGIPLWHELRMQNIPTHDIAQN